MFWGTCSRGEKTQTLHKNPRCLVVCITVRRRQGKVAALMPSSSPWIKLVREGRSGGTRLLWIYSWRRWSFAGRAEASQPCTCASMTSLFGAC